MLVASRRRAPFSADDGRAARNRDRELLDDDDLAVARVIQRLAGLAAD
ncbi:MAG: hypothetical protein JO057_06625 [Chloroflexi bacterium]|nr:hypothetical protein [Chloroflexota bacterium]